MIEVFVFIFGAIFGSFADATVWRMRKKQDWVRSRSACDSCGHALGALDLIPIASWLLQGGKCRYCKKHITYQHLVSELTLGLIFLGSYAFWPKALEGTTSIAQFIFWLLICVGFCMLTIYDLKDKLLPSPLVYVLYVPVVGYLLTQILAGSGSGLVWSSLIGSVCVGGLFYVLFQVSNGAWIGGGDVRLGYVIGALVGGPLMAMLAIFLASFMGTLITLPFMAIKKTSTKAQIPFGPFLMAGCLVVILFGGVIKNWMVDKGLVLQ